MGMHQSSTGRKLTQNREGFRKAAYQDGGGVWTIGYGHTKGVKEGMICDEVQAQKWYDEDIAVAEYDVELYVTVPLTQGQFDALVDWTFNLGGNNLRISTMLRCINNKDWNRVVPEMLRWDHDGGKVVKGLTERRQEEAKLWKGEL